MVSLGVSYFLFWFLASLLLIYKGQSLKYLIHEDHSYNFSHLLSLFLSLFLWFPTSIVGSWSWLQDFNMVLELELVQNFLTSTHWYLGLFLLWFSNSIMFSYCSFSSSIIRHSSWLFALVFIRIKFFVVLVLALPLQPQRHNPLNFGRFRLFLITCQTVITLACLLWYNTILKRTTTPEVGQFL